MKTKGYIQVYTGNGKGKTTAALGLALRAVCAGKRVYIGQFIKGQDYSELKANALISGLTMEQYGDLHFIKNEPSELDYKQALEGCKKAEEAIQSNDYDIVVLDEINVAIQLNLIPENKVLTLIKAKPEKLELILTGRGATQNVIDAADLVTEMKEIKHYYQKGVQARVGIEK